MSIVDRLKEWEKFNEKMKQNLKEAQEKYGMESAVDLMEFTDERICLYSILKYALRNWNGKGKKGDYFKIAHFSQMGEDFKNASETITHSFEHKSGFSEIDIESIHMGSEQIPKDAETRSCRNCDFWNKHPKEEPCIFCIHQDNRTKEKMGVWVFPYWKPKSDPVLNERKKTTKELLIKTRKMLEELEDWEKIKKG